MDSTIGMKLFDNDHQVKMPDMKNLEPKEQQYERNLIIIPPVEDERCPEIEGYTNEYVQYMAERMDEYRREHGEDPQWVRDRNYDPEKPTK